MMERAEDLAAAISDEVRMIRLRRGGMVPPEGVGRDQEIEEIRNQGVGFHNLPEAERSNWIDIAIAARSVLHDAIPAPPPSVKRETLLREFAHDIGRMAYLHVRAWALRRIPTRVWRWWLLQLAVNATREELIGRHAYAGPDNVDYERMWWAIEDMLPPHREEEIRRPASVPVVDDEPA